MNENGDLPSWIGGIAAACGLIWAFFKRFFATVTRAELQESIAEMRSERREMHAENQETLARIHERVDALWERVA